MWFTFPHITRGWFTESLSWRGRGGTRIPESGMAARTSHSESASESASSEVLDGAGLIGDSIGITDTQCITTTGTTPGAGRFTTGATSTEVEARAAEFTLVAVELKPAPTQGTGLLAGTPARSAEFTTVPARRPGLSTE